MRYFRKHFLWPALVLIAASAAPAAAFAQATIPSTQNEVAGATTGLGSSHRFPAPAAALAHCPNDTIVWSSGPKLVYELPNSTNYGKGQGFYACKAEADDAGFHAAGN
jgi:hypothetical protein